MLTISYFTTASKQPGRAAPRHDAHALASLRGALEYAARRYLVDNFELLWAILP